MRTSALLCLLGVAAACSGTGTDAPDAGPACTPTTCFALGKDCGEVPDGCGGTLRCGLCQGRQTCGAGGTPNVCGCAPATCESLAIECGVATDGCGGRIFCGGCAAPLACGAERPNRCGDPASAPPAGCSHDAWCREEIVPLRPVLRAMTKDGSGWVVGDGGAIWGGLLEVGWGQSAVDWGPYESGTTRDLRAVEDDWEEAWAVGDHVITHWDGVRWTSETVDASLFDVAASYDGGRVQWAVGDKVLHRDGQGWSEVFRPSGTLTGVWADRRRVWAVGETGGTVLHFDGTTWSRIEPLAGVGSAFRYRAVYGRGDYGVAGAGWVEVAGDGGVLARFENGTWRRVPVATTEPIRWLSGSCAATSTQVFRRTASGWDAVSGTAPMRGCVASGQDRFDWVEGIEAGSPPPGELGLVVIDAAGRRFPAIGADVAGLAGIWASSETDAWTVGTSGTVLHFDGATWSQVESDTSSRLHGVTGLSAGAAWAFGEGSTLIGWDGARWSDFDPASRRDRTSEASHRALVARAPDDFIVYGAVDWAVDEATAWARRRRGTQWTDEPTPLANEQYGMTLSVTRAGPTELWAAVLVGYDYRGGHRALSHFDGAAWTLDFHRNEANAVWASGPEDVWAVGQDGSAIHFDGREWRSFATGTSEHLVAVWGSRSDDVWAVGGTEVVHWDGVRWTRQATPATKPLRAIGGAGGAVWAVGDGGTILRLRR